MEYQTSIIFFPKKLTHFLCATGDRKKKLPTVFGSPKI